MSKFWWFLGALLSGWLTFKFYTEGQGQVGQHNNMAVVFTGVICAVCIWGFMDSKKA